MNNNKVYNVQIWAEELDKRQAEKTKVYTYKSNNWNPDFIVFYPDNSMDFYKMKEHLHGYVKKHYSKIPQKYLNYKYEAR